jgi:Zn finger protein HypA/HybF involved in hydrogenase expression
MTKRKFDKTQFEDAVKSSKSISATMKKLGLCSTGGGAYRTFFNAAKEFGVDFSHFTGQMASLGRRVEPKLPIDVILTKGRYLSTHKLKLRLLKEGIFEKKCYNCGLIEWLNNPIPLQLDHIDGDNRNNELSNLRIICPNCHAQTSTWCGKNKKTVYVNTCKNCEELIKSGRVYCTSCYLLLTKQY